MIVFGIILGLFVLVLLVVIHELGHALVAKRNGVKVEEFGIGFPPVAKKRKFKNSFLGKDVTFSLNWLPLGGFVRLKGEYDSATGKETYGGASFWVKTKILLAGVMMNWLTAIILFSILAVVGLPKLVPNQVVMPFDSSVEKSPLTVVQVADGTPAQKLGIKKGDYILRIGSDKVNTPEELSLATKKQAGKEVEIELVRSGKASAENVTLATIDQAKNGGYLGVATGQSEKIYSTWSAPLVGLATTGQLTYETFKGVGGLLAKTFSGFLGQIFGSAEQKQAARAKIAEVSNNVAGPIGILGVLFPSVLDSGIAHIILLAAVISLTLAVMNTLPIPALDGGRWFTMAGFRLFRKKLTQEREETIQAIGFLTIMLITVLTTWSDIAKLF